MTAPNAPDDDVIAAIRERLVLPWRVTDLGYAHEFAWVDSFQIEHTGQIPSTAMDFIIHAPEDEALLLSALDAARAERDRAWADHKIVVDELNPALREIGRLEDVERTLRAQVAALTKERDAALAVEDTLWQWHEVFVAAVRLAATGYPERAIVMLQNVDLERQPPASAPTNGSDTASERER